MTTRRPPLMDGAAALERLAEQQGGVMKLLAANTVFLHPDTVAQTGGQPLFRVIRDHPRRGQTATINDSDGVGVEVMCCDNHTPTVAFLWSAQRSRGTDVQFNHVWSDSRNWRHYTALWNLCATPAFLAKLTDGTRRPESVSALRYRAWELFQHSVGDVPTKPAGYDELEWHDPLDPIPDLEAELRQRLNESPKSRAAISARQLGWLFSDWQPDPTVGAAGRSRLEELVATLDGNELVDALVQFDYAPSDVATADKGSPEWWQQVQDRDIATDSLEHLQSLVIMNAITAEAYGQVLERLKLSDS